jgi:LysR family transcriptional regulator, glycine cleavage system transcriptional activator
MCRLVTPLPKIRVRRTGYVALTAVEEEKAGQSAAFVAWLTAEGHSS